MGRRVTGEMKRTLNVSKGEELDGRQGRQAGGEGEERDALVVEIEEKLVIKSLNVLDGVDNRLEVLILWC